VETELVQRIIAYQRNIGIDIRLLVAGPANGTIADFVLFDGEISHETAPVTRQDYGALITRLVLSPEAIQNRTIQFQALWQLGVGPS